MPFAPLNRSPIHSRVWKISKWSTVDMQLQISSTNRPFWPGRQQHPNTPPQEGLSDP
jgi:hypothetical protein